MKEDFLHYVWKYQLFSKKKLQTTSKESLEIISTGVHNHNAGPDFLNAKIRIDGQLWAGNVEIHLKASDWYAHQHEKDANYDAVILHVVLEDDVQIFNSSNQPIVTLQLKNSIPNAVLNNYKQLFAVTKKWINCEKSIATIDAFIFQNWLERLYIERLESKAIEINFLLKETNNNWEAVLFQLLAKSFGLKINSVVFFELSKTIDFSIIRKERFNAEHLEALFFGQAGLLNDANENSYHLSLKAHYTFLKHKYKLKTSFCKVQFFRLRPANFPTIRLSQLAQLYHKHENLFSKLMNSTNQLEFYNLFNVATSIYWQTHYTFDKTSKKRIKSISKSFIDLVLINAIIPLQFVYQKAIGKDNVSAILNLARQISTEKNTIINQFKTLYIKPKNAHDSQALLQLKNNYCSKQKCLQCLVGSVLLKRNAN